MTKDVCRIRRRNILRFMADVLIWLTVAIPVLYLFLHGKPYERGFYCYDEALSYPYKSETLSTPALLVAGFALSVVVVVITEALNCIDRKCRHLCLDIDTVVYNLKSYGVFLVGFILQQFVVEVVKKKTGVLRPNFFDVCRPRFNTTLCPGYITDYMCTGSSLNEIRESRLAFPSGHSSLSMYIAIYFCLYIEQRLQISFCYILKLVFQSGLIFLAILCGIDRVLDNKHHVSDVVTGFILGIIVALTVHRTIGRTVLNLNKTRNNGTSIFQPTQSTCGCCICDSKTSEPEPQTPMPLLDNEFLDSLNHTTTTTLKIKDPPFFVRRHYSTPITPTRAEDIV